MRLHDFVWILAGRVIQIPQARNVFIFAASLVISGQVLAADVESELLHFDCVRVSYGAEPPLKLGSGASRAERLFDSERGKLRCESSPKIGGGLPASRDAVQTQGVIELNRG